MEFSLDWQAGSGRLVNIAYRSPLITRDRAQAYHQSDPTVPVQPSQEHMPWLDGPFRCTPPPSWPVRAGGHRFLYTQGISRHGFPGIATLWNADESLIRPVAAFGFASELLAGTNPFAGSARQFAEIKAALPDEAHRFGFIWSDLDADQHMQPGEFQFLPFDEKIPFIIGTHIEPDLALTFLNLEFGRVPAPTFNDRGIPVWNGSAHQRLVTSQGTISFHHEAGVPLVGERDVVLSMWGWEHYTPIQGFARDGGLRWTWRTYAEGAVPQTPAQVAMAYSVAGGVIRPHAGEAGEIWLTGGSKGANYLFTTDGLLVATLGGHLANTPMWRMPHLARGASLTGVSFEDEAFQTSLQQYQNGDIYGVFGKEHISICRLAGLETVRRMDWGTYTLTQDQVAGLPEVLAETPRPSYRQRLAVVHGGTAPVIDGSLDDWAGADWAVIDPRCRAAVRIVGDRLYAAYRTGDPDLLANQAEDHRFLFKRGGALDLCLGPAPETNQHHWELRDLRQECGPDDRRLLVSLVRGQPVATLYRPVLPDPRPTQRERFESPVGRCDMDAVLDLSKHIELAGQHGDFEFAVSLADLCGLPVPGPTGDLLGDLGIIRGDGQQNIQRACWNNIDTAMTSDIPTEVRLNPATWGVFHLQPDTP